MSESYLKYGMVGGASDSFMGKVHRTSVRFDKKANLVSGCFSRKYEKTLKTGKRLGLKSNRLYENIEKMAEKEKDKIDFVSIVVPNSSHFEIAKVFLENNINVYIEKPLTCTLEEAKKLQEIIKKRKAILGINYSYSGYPMVKQAKEMIKHNEIGEIKMVKGEYLQESIASSFKKNNNISDWRLNPEISGVSNCVADIGTHIENTISYLTDLKINSLSANLQSFSNVSELDDNAEIMIKYNNGATGIYWASKVAIGHENGLKLRIYGDKGSIFWDQENPEYLTVSYLNKPKEILSRSRDDLYPLAQRVTRLPAGHPEGLFSAFANMYNNFIEAIIGKKNNENYSSNFDFPSIDEGVRGVKFVHKCIESSSLKSSWINF